MRAVLHRDEAGLTDDQISKLMTPNREYQTKLIPLLREAHGTRAKVREYLHSYNLAAQADTARASTKQLADLLHEINLLFLEYVQTGMGLFTPDQIKTVDSIARQQLNGLGLEL